MPPASASDGALGAQFHTSGVALHIAGIRVNIRTDVPHLPEQIQYMYSGHRFETAAGIDDFQIYLSYTNKLRRFVKRQTQVYVDGTTHFIPAPERLSYISLESALNWCISQTLSNVVLHAAVVERDGVAVVLPAPSASGKSTLCAALVLRGWRLLSDELCVIRPQDGRLQPTARPISLKNESIALIQRWAPDSQFSPLFAETSRGTIAFLRPPAASVARAAEPAEPGLIVSPSWRADATPALQSLGKSESFRLLAGNSLNYFATQRLGFETLAGLVDRCASYRLSYATLAEAVETMETLLARTLAARRRDGRAAATA